MPQSKFSFEKLHKELGKRCGNCGSENNIQYHHIVPLAKGGNDILSNIAPLCEDCHRLVHGRHSSGISHSELTKLGIERARAEGKQIGLIKGTKLTTKKSVEAKKYILENSHNFNGDKSNADIIRELGISKNTYYKYQKELQEELKLT